MKLGSITRKLKSLLGVLVYAALAYGAYLAYLNYQAGGVDLVLDYLYSLPVEVLLIVAVAGAAVLAVSLGQ